MNLATKILAGMIAFVLITGATSDNKLTDRQRALHALNRLAFGPRPGEVDAVMKDGVNVWIEQQLHPEGIPDRAVEARIAALPTMKMSNAQIVKTYYEPVLMARKKANAEAKDGDIDKNDVRRELMRDIPFDQRPQIVTNDLLTERIVRAAESDRQLNEVMVDFWMNHFNVFAGKGIDRFLLTSYERDVIRPHIWGRFEDLLMATAKSPAMLFYLDNARSVAAPENRPVLAHHPATAHHIAVKLCQRLVADDPPRALVDRVAAKFLATDGDLRETVRAVISSPEFWDPKSYRAKVKSPFEYAISAVRAFNAQITDATPIARALQQIGEPLYGAQPPTGYSDNA